MNDHALLQQFLTERNEPAFAELVRRNVDLVFSAALRQTGNQALAEDVTQTVFVLLSRKAQSIRRGEALAGWLLVTTRYAARNALRSESRRRRHEQGAAAMKSEIEASDESNWHSIKPLLDDAVARLKRDDRDAITLRYFKGHSLSQVAEALGISEAAAQKRVSRALERLRIFFSRSGVTATSQGLASLLALHVTTAAPANLTAQIVQHALIPTLAKTKGAVILMAATKTKVVVLSAVAFLFVGVSATVVYRHMDSASAPVTAPQPQQSAMSALTAHDILAATYGLPTGQNVMRIQPPFLPERLAVYRDRYGDKPSPDAAIFRWGEQGLEDDITYWQTGASLTVGQVLTVALKIWPQDTDLPPQIIARTVRGDWVFRRDVSKEVLAADFATTISEALGAGTTLRPEMVDREVIVVRGQASFKPLPRMVSAKRAVVDLQIARPTTMPGHRWATAGGGTVDILMTLGEVLRWPVVIETNLDAKAFGACTVDPSADFRMKDPPDGAVVDEVLSQVTEQTGLELSREHRTVQIWRLVPASP